MCKWWAIGAIGLFVLFFFAWIIFRRGQSFDTSLLGLFTLGLGLIIISIIQPTNLKFGEVEMVVSDARKATKEAETAALLVNETTAMLLWNAGRFGVGSEPKAAINLLEKVHGKEKAKEILQYFVDRDIFKTTKEEKKEILKDVPRIDNPVNITSPLVEMMDRK